MRIELEPPYKSLHFCSRSCNGKFYWSKGFNKAGVSHGASNSALIE